MSTSEYDAVAEKYDHMLSDYHQQLNLSRQRIKRSKIKLGEFKAFFSGDMTEKMSFFNNYNVVESVLIFAALLISIAAIMFERLLFH